MSHKTWWLAILCCVALPVFADTPIVDHREANQRQRIASGVQSGELTRAETQRLAHAEHTLNRHEAQAKADGVVTPSERQSLRQESRHVSQRIAVQKHDGQERRK
jgi:hypothetical protein